MQNKFPISTCSTPSSATQAELDRIIAGQDAFDERRNRVLDSLLALYGEHYPESELRRFDVYYHHQYIGRQILLQQSPFVASFM